MFPAKKLIVTVGFGLLLIASSAAAQTEKLYKEPPRDINMEGRYRTLARLCFGGRMAEAEQKAADVLDVGYIGTRYECWVWNKLAAGYERQGNAPKAIEFYQRAMDSSDPRKGAYSQAIGKIRALGGTPRVGAAPGNPPPPMPQPRSSTPQPARPATPQPPEPPQPPARPTPRPVVPDAGGERSYIEPPRDINMEGKYRTFTRLTFTGQLAEAEAKAQEILKLGYTGTRYECWVWIKLAGGYERMGNSGKAIDFYRKTMTSSDPRKGSYTRARDKILELGGSLAGS